MPRSGDARVPRAAAGRTTRYFFFGANVWM